MNIIYIFLRNTSHQMGYTRILYYAYTMYMPKIYIVYPKNILYIYIYIYIYIPSIYNVHTKSIQCIYLVYAMYILRMTI